MRLRKQELATLSALLEDGAPTPEGWIAQLAALTDDRVPERFWSKVDLDNDTGCWNWTAYRTPKGYGAFALEHRLPVGAHRYLYQIVFGDVGDLHVDHLCRNRACCNPAHLEAVSARVNVVVRGTGHSAQNARKTHCKWEHPLSGDNLYVEGTRRRCRECARKRGREWEARERQKRDKS